MSTYLFLFSHKTRCHFIGAYVLILYKWFLPKKKQFWENMGWETMKYPIEYKNTI